MDVPIKEFQKNIYKYLLSLPVTLTRHGKPFAVIQKASDLKVATFPKVATKKVATFNDNTQKVATIDTRPMWSDTAKEGYKLVPFVGKYKRI